MFERLHDLYFATDHRPMLAVHHLWLQAAPDQPRARVMDVVWKTALGQQVAARQVEERLVAAYPEQDRKSVV